jgi:DNA-binding NarL/FixJ family response regulator
MMRVSVVSEYRLPAELVALALRGERELQVANVIAGAAALESEAGARALRAPVLLFAALVPPEAGLLARVLNGGRATTAGQAIVVADLCGCVGVAPALQLGARGYVAPWEQIGVLAPRVLQAGQGSLAVPPGALDGLRQAMKLLVREAGALHRLAESDLEIMRGVAGGDRTKELAARLNMTEATLRGRLRRIMHDLGVRNGNELSAMAASAGLYEPRTPTAR